MFLVIPKNTKNSLHMRQIIKVVLKWGHGCAQENGIVLRNVIYLNEMC